MQGGVQAKRIFCLANTDLSVACRGDKAILVPNDPSDKSQQWIQDYSAVGNLTDEQGYRAFALVNRTTGQAIVNDSGKLQLAPYNGKVAVQLSMLWSLAGEPVPQAPGFSMVRALGGDESDGGHYTRILSVLGVYPVNAGDEVGTYYYSVRQYARAVWKIE